MHHIGTFTGDHHFEIDSIVDLQIDQIKRKQLARVHSAGHLVDMAMTRAGRPDLVPTKGYHFEQGSYVEYSG